ncbi:MAG: ATP-binding protein [Verrucomicrobiae bacterium]|nr:ATP-binding protein [Verrucomicrobiae bacterium]
MGPRQCGKTTLARQMLKGRPAAYFDLENPRDLARLQNPMRVLEALRGVVVIDEIQCRPDLMPVLRVLADRRPLPCRFLILGSAAPELIRHASESLAGRVHFVDIGGFCLEELGSSRQQPLWFRGGFPLSFLAKSDRQSLEWRENFVRTFLERDIPQFGIQIPAATLRRFWTMLAHYHGQTWNGSEIAASLGVAHTTTRRYLDVLTGAFMVRQLPPWFENVGKRVVKSPKIYLRDSGVLHTLLQIESLEDLEGHPKLGASWEGFALEEILRWSGDRNAYFWATHGGTELDLLLVRRGRRWGFEFKCSEAPTMTRSMHEAMRDLKLERLWVVFPGATSFPIHERVECVGLREFSKIRRWLEGKPS